MDIEHFIGIEKLLNIYLIPDIVKIIFKYLDLKFERIIDSHIKSQRKLINIISFELKNEFDLEYHIEFELFNIIEHLERWEHPDFVEVEYTYPLFDFQTHIKYNNFVWEIEGDLEPEHHFEFED